MDSLSNVPGKDQNLTWQSSKTGQPMTLNVIGLSMRKGQEALGSYGTEAGIQRAFL